MNKIETVPGYRWAMSQVYVSALIRNNCNAPLVPVLSVTVLDLAGNPVTSTSDKVLPEMAPGETRAIVEIVDMVRAGMPLELSPGTHRALIGVKPLPAVLAKSESGSVPLSTLGPTGTPAPEAQSAPAVVQETLQVQPLPVPIELTNEIHFTPPKNVTIYVPEPYAGTLAAYGVNVNTEAIIGPREWTGDWKPDVIGGFLATLMPKGASRNNGPRITYMHLTRAQAIGGAIGYFETASARYQAMFGSSPGTYKSPQFVGRSFINDRVLAYRLPNAADGLGVDGVAYYKDGDINKADFRQMEVTMPLSQRDLSTVILDVFIATNVPK